MTRWTKTVDVRRWFEDDQTDLQSNMRGATEQVKSTLCKEIEKDPDLFAIVDELGDAADEDDVAHWNYVWNELYNWADANHVWIATM